MTAQKVDSLGPYFTFPAMAEALGVAPTTLRIWVARHNVPVTKLGSTPLLRLDDLGEFRVRLKLIRKLLETIK
jgi:hypothetical protein